MWEYVRVNVRAGRAGSRHTEVEVAARILRASNNGEVADAASHRSTDDSFLLGRPGQLANIDCRVCGQTSAVERVRRRSRAVA